MLPTGVRGASCFPTECVQRGLFGYRPKAAPRRYTQDVEGLTPVIPRRIRHVPVGVF